MATDYFQETRDGPIRYNDPIYKDILGRPLPTEARIENPAKYAQYKTVYDSYSGTDIVATIILPGEDLLTLGSLHTLSYSTHRENTPVRFLGHSAPCGFVKGPRTIAGHLVFTQFNEYVWYKLKAFSGWIKQGVYPMADMLPPFDIVISFSNESGSFSKQKIFGVSIIDEGGAMSVDDLMIETEYTFMARGMEPMTSYIPDGYAILNDGKPEASIQKDNSSSNGILIVEA